MAVNGKTTVGGFTYSQRDGGTAVNRPNKYTVLIGGSASPVETDYTFGPDWTTITWDASSMAFLEIKNQYDVPDDDRPTTVVRGDVDAGTVLEVAITPDTGTAYASEGNWLVYPGETMRGVPQGNVHIRVQSGTASVDGTVTTFPR